MKTYEIYDRENDLSVGVLLYYEKEKSFIIELAPDLDEWTAPLLLTAQVKRGVYTIPRDISFLWVKGRVVPSERQNIQAILRAHKLKEYDEMKLLEITEGRCPQDSMIIRRIDALPAYVTERRRKNLTDCLVSEHDYWICFFADDTVRKVSFLKLWANEGLQIPDNPELLRAAKVGTDGYFVTLDDAYDIPASVLYEAGTLIPLRPDDFTSYVTKNALDTSQSCELLECSRQNLSYLIKQGQLQPIREEVKGSLFRKGDILRKMW
jgi:hypothetical protein